MMNNQTPQSVLQWHDLVHTLALEYSLPKAIILAQVWTESTGNPWATRYDSGWRYFWKNGPLWDKQKSVDTNRRIALNLLGSTEFHLQSTSMGLLQVMGAVARERGLKEDLPRLYDPEVGIRYGCIHLSIFLRSEGGDIRRALDRYNGSLSYADKVLVRAKMG